MNRFRKANLVKIGKQILRHLTLMAVGAVFLLPLLWMVSTSLKTNRQIFVYPPQWIPNPVIWRSYSEEFYYATFLL